MTNEHQNTYNHTHTHKHLNHYHIRIRYFIIQLFFISQIANFSIRGQDLASKTSQIISFQRSRQALFTLIAKNSLLCSEYQGLEEQKQAWLCGRKRWCMLSVFLVSERKEVFLFPSCRRRPFLTTRSEAEGRGESSYLPPAHTEPWWLSHIEICLYPQPILDTGPRSQLLIYSRTQKAVLLIGWFHSPVQKVGARTKGLGVPAHFRGFRSSSTLGSCKDQFKFHFVYEPCSQLFKYSGISSLICK